MSVLTLAIIICSLFGIALFAGILLLIYLAGKRSVVDNPNKAIVLVKEGQHTRSFIGDIVAQEKVGSAYLYNRGKKLALLPNKYKPLYHRCKRLIFMAHPNRLIASPFDDDAKLTPAEREDLIYQLVSGKVGADGMRALRGSSSMSIVVVAIVCLIIGAVATFGIFQVQKVMKQNQAIQQQVPKPPANTPTVVEVE